ncbi:MAG TPA: hypothetical protein V6D11_05395 [Waterburya sp.]|jgi:hypothetical protein
MRAFSRQEKQGFSKPYTAEELVRNMLLDRFFHNIVKKYLKKFYIEQELNDSVLKKYVQQFYIHSTQDLRAKRELSFESFVRLINNREEPDDYLIYYYILGFEILKMIFQMSWLQHERLYGLQKNQESFIKTYIKPIQHTHRINGIIVPKYERVFFAKRSYFVKKPQIKEKKLTELVMATFTADTVTNLGFLIIRHLNFLVFDYDYIFGEEPESLFLA